MPLQASWILAYRGGEMMLYKNKQKIDNFLRAFAFKVLTLNSPATAPDICIRMGSFRQAAV